MKKLFKCVIISIVNFVFVILPVFSSENQLPEEKKTMLIEKLKTASLVIYKDGEITTYTEHNLVPVIKYLDTNDNFKGAFVFDKTVGRTAAYLYVYGNADYVYADTISKPAKKILKKNKIKFEYKKAVSEIKNKDNTDLCPFEKLTKNAINSSQAYGLIYKKTYPDSAIVYFTHKISP